VPLRAILLNAQIWLELCILLPHCPPFYTTSIGVEHMQNWYAYRIESIGALYQVLRCYTA
jgi:hypothetical protein